MLLNETKSREQLEKDWIETRKTAKKEKWHSIAEGFTRLSNETLASSFIKGWKLMDKLNELKKQHLDKKQKLDVHDMVEYAKSKWENDSKEHPSFISKLKADEITKNMDMSKGLDDLSTDYVDMSVGLNNLENKSTIISK